MAHMIVITDPVSPVVLDSRPTVVIENARGPVGPRGPQGPQGPQGEPGDGMADPGDLTLLFENKLI